METGIIKSKPKNTYSLKKGGGGYPPLDIPASKHRNYQCHLWMQFSQVQVFQQQLSLVTLVRIVNIDHDHKAYFR